MVNTCEVPCTTATAPDGEMPPPAPADAVMVNVGAERPAVRDAVPETVKLHGWLVPVQSPLQPVKVWPTVAVAVTLTTVPSMYEALAPLQPAVQSIAAGLETRRPVPVPDFATE